MTLELKCGETGSKLLKRSMRVILRVPKRIKGFEF